MVERSEIMVKSEKLLQYQHHHLLDDFEILAALSYTKRLINKKDPKSRLEFKDLSSFFFGGDENAAMNTLLEIDKLYQNEYFKRHQN